jgi:hypothetical protein
MRAEEVYNRAIAEELGLPELIIGSFFDGSPASEGARRVYGPTLRQLLRTAHWSFARVKGPLQLLGDATGDTLAPNGQPISTAVERPWRYAYAWPVDGVAARWMPHHWGSVSDTPPGNYAIPSPPPPGVGPSGPGNFVGWREMPARFLVTTSDQFPLTIAGNPPPDLDDIEGAGAITRRIVLTDVCEAHLVYTKLLLEPVLWDENFTQAMVAVLAQRMAMSLIADKKFALAVRNAQIAIAKDMIREARVASANEGGFPQSVGHTPDYIRARQMGGYAGGRGGLAIGDAGVLWYGWNTIGFADGSVY